MERRSSMIGAPHSEALNDGTLAGNRTQARGLGNTGRGFRAMLGCPFNHYKAMSVQISPVVDEKTTVMVAPMVAPANAD